MMRIISLAAITAVLVTLSGCASIAGDNTRLVKMETQPAGASINIDNQQYGVTPAVVTLPTSIYGGKIVTFKKKGYQDQSMTINSKFQPVALLDILFWPSIIIDGISGNLVKIEPSNLNLHATLQRA